MIQDLQKLTPIRSSMIYTRHEDPKTILLIPDATYQVRVFSRQECNYSSIHSVRTRLSERLGFPKRIPQLTSRDIFDWTMLTTCESVLQTTTALLYSKIQTDHSSH